MQPLYKLMEINSERLVIDRNKLTATALRSRIIRSISIKIRNGVL